MCDKAVKRDVGLKSLMAEGWYMVNNLDDERYLKPCRGRQRKTWKNLIVAAVKSRQSGNIS